MNTKKDQDTDQTTEQVRELINYLSYLDTSMNTKYSNYKVEYIKESGDIEIYFINHFGEAASSFIQFHDEDSNIYIWSDYSENYSQIHSLEDLKNITNIFFI